MTRSRPDPTHSPTSPPPPPPPPPPQRPPLAREVEVRMGFVVAVAVVIVVAAVAVVIVVAAVAVVVTDSQCSSFCWQTCRKVVWGQPVSRSY